DYYCQVWDITGVHRVLF
nr:immunoglobulin light chain junction region [Macaca mulatta]MOX30388.1 immunoglobulin light chain junction region [Macaca mulatta]MOX30956.1 immunoglobulin light chain junction region [Macaca mulatta]MOX31998.1 immunoglobulin light chain junction region [Macaca mulatta]MOX33174.1 immunoglobulin light chain junction region [Macaca mulatta]